MSTKAKKNRRIIKARKRYIESIPYLKEITEKLEAMNDDQRSLYFKSSDFNRDMEMLETFNPALLNKP